MCPHNSYPRREFLRRLTMAGAGFLLAHYTAGRTTLAQIMKGDGQLQLVYGDHPLAIDTPEGLIQIVTPHAYPVLADVSSAIADALAHPIGSTALSQRVRPGQKIAIAISDRTRIFPQRQMIEALLDYLRGQCGVDAKDITFVVGNGNHAVDPLETLDLGGEIIQRYQFVNFDSTRYGDMKRLGHTEPLDPAFFGRAAGRAWTDGWAHSASSFMAGLQAMLRVDPDSMIRSLHGGPLLETGLAWHASRGTEVWVDQTVAETDLVIGIGQIKPHPLTGYSGGVKAIVPAVSGRRSIISNHLLQVHPSVGLGMVNDNILRLDLENACALLPNVFILNVVTNGNKKPASFVAGDPVAAHRAGVNIAEKICRVPAEKADIVIYSNKAQGRMNLYQFIKSLAVAKDIVKPGGAIIAVGDLPDGAGNRMKINPIFAVREVYYHYNYSYQMPADVSIYLVCSKSWDVARGTFFIPAPSVDVAVRRAKEKIGSQATVSVIPDTDMVLPG